MIRVQKGKDGLCTWVHLSGFPGDKSYMKPDGGVYGGDDAFRADLKRALEDSFKPYGSSGDSQYGIVTAFLNQGHSAAGKILEEFGFGRTPWLEGKIHPRRGVAVYFYCPNIKASKKLPDNEKFKDFFKHAENAKPKKGKGNPFRDALGRFAKKPLGGVLGR